MDLPLPRHQLQSWPCDVCKFDMLHVKHLKIHTCWGLEYVVTTSPLKTSNNYRNILNALNTLEYIGCSYSDPAKKPATTTRQEDAAFSANSCELWS